jgi:hypothetical protein
MVIFQLDVVHNWPSYKVPQKSMDEIRLPLSFTEVHCH